MSRKLGALLLAVAIPTLAAWAGPYDPLDYNQGKHNVSRAPAPPKPFEDKDGLRFYALDEFAKDETNVGKKQIWHNAAGPSNKPLAIGEQGFKRGICYVQKPEIETYVQWHLDGKFANLDATVGVPDDFHGVVTVFVYGDDRRLFRSEDITAEHHSEKIDVPIDGVELLSIRTHATKDVGPVHVVIGEPTITREPGI